MAPSSKWTSDQHRLRCTRQSARPFPPQTGWREARLLMSALGQKQTSIDGVCHPLSRRRTGGFQTKSGTEFGDAVEVYIQFVLLQKRSRFCSVRPNSAQFPPIIFKSSGRYDLNDFTWRIARVPERMPLAARFEHPRTCLGCNDSVTKQCTEGAS